MRELTRPRLIVLKGTLFLICSALACAILIIEHPQPLTIALLIIAIWSFARFYYFAFYVIATYVDPSFRFSGIVALARHVAQHRRSPK